MEHYWNHRVVKKTYETGEVEYSVRETHYNEDGTIYAYTIDPTSLACESIEGLREYIGWCLKALDKPILEDGKVEFVDYDDDLDDIDFGDLDEEDLL